jgi:hypothetical protein
MSYEFIYFIITGNIAEEPQASYETLSGQSATLSLISAQRLNDIAET